MIIIIVNYYASTSIVVMVAHSLQDRGSNKIDRLRAHNIDSLLKRINTLWRIHTYIHTYTCTLGYLYRKLLSHFMFSVCGSIDKVKSTILR